MILLSLVFLTLLSLRVRNRAFIMCPTVFLPSRPSRRSRIRSGHVESLRLGSSDDSRQDDGSVAQQCAVVVAVNARKSPSAFVGSRTEIAMLEIVLNCVVAAAAIRCAWLLVG